MKMRLAVLATVFLMTSGAAYGQGALHTLTSPSGSLVCQIMDPTATNRYNAGIRFSNVAQVLSAQFGGKEFLQCNHPVTYVDPTPDHNTSGDGGLAMEFDLGENSIPPGSPVGATQMNNPPGYHDATSVATASYMNPVSWFVVLGVGVLSKDDGGANYAWGHTYPVVTRAATTADWSRPDRAHFVSDTTGTPANGYAYKLEEDVIAGDGVLTMNYKLTNTGTKYFETDQFNHNFLVYGPAGGTPDTDSTHYENQWPYALTGSGSVMDIVGPGYWRYSTASTATMTWATLGGWDKPFVFPPAGPHGNWEIIRNRTQGQALVCAMSLNSNWMSTYTNIGPYQIAPEQNTPIYLNPGQMVQYSRTYIFMTSNTARLASAVPVDQTHVQAFFSLPIDPTTASALSNYALDGGVTISGASVDPGNLSVTLTTSQMSAGSTYTLTAANVKDSGGSFIAPNPGTAVFTVPTAPPPTILSASATDLSHVSVAFSKAMDPVTTSTPSNYAIAGVTITGASLGADPTTVTLTTASTMPMNTAYTVTVSNVKDADLPTPNLIAANSTKTFTTPTGPTLVSATAVDSTHLTVAFSKAVSPATATSASNYALSNGLSVLAAATATASSVTLTTSPLNVGITNTLSVRNIQDLAGLTISPNPSTATFTYKVALVQYPFGAAAYSSTTTGGGLSAVTSVIPNNVTVNSLSSNLGSTWSNMIQWSPTTTPTASNQSFTQTGTSATAGTFLQFGFTVAPGYTANLSSLTFLASRNWNSDPKGMYVESSLTGFANPTTTPSAALTAQVITTGSSTTMANGPFLPDGYQGGGVTPYYSSITVDLSSTSSFQNITGGTTVAFRIYGFTNNEPGLTLFCDDITVWGGTRPVGTPPTVAITSPTSTYNAAIGNSVTFTAAVTVTTSGATLSSLQFYDGATLLGSGSAAGGGMYTFAWNTAGKSAGLHNVTAVAIDSAGFQATSAPATVINLSAPPGPPSVAITSPTSATIAGAGNAISLVATASTTRAGGSILAVQFYDGATLLGSGSLQAGTWTYFWTTTGATLGTHTVTARATDNASVSATSAPLTVVFRMIGDGNGDGAVDGEDYGVWQNGYGHTASFATGDYNGDGAVDGEDYGVWQNNYGRTAGSSDAVAAADDASGIVASAMAPASAGTAPRLIAVAPASGSVASGVTSLTLVFDSNVVATAGAVEVSGLATGPHANYTASYDAATCTLMLTFNSALPPDQYAVRVIADFVTGAGSGAPLDGETGSPAAATLPSGDGAPGGDAQIEFTAE